MRLHSFHWDCSLILLTHTNPIIHTNPIRVTPRDSLHWHHCHNAILGTHFVIVNTPFSPLFSPISYSSKETANFIYFFAIFHKENLLNLSFF